MTDGDGERVGGIGGLRYFIKAEQARDHLLDLVQHFPTKTRWSRTLRLIHGYPLK